MGLEIPSEKREDAEDDKKFDVTEAFVAKVVCGLLKFERVEPRGVFRGRG